MMERLNRLAGQRDYGPGRERELRVAGSAFEYLARLDLVGVETAALGANGFAIGAGKPDRLEGRKGFILRPDRRGKSSLNLM
jgi:hypothetical protein